MLSNLKRKPIWLIAIALVAVLGLGLVLFNEWSKDPVRDSNVDTASQDDPATDDKDGVDSQDIPLAQEYAGIGERFSAVIHFTESGVHLVHGENVSYVIYPTDEGRSCGPEVLQDADLIKQAANEVVLTAEHVGQTICFTAEFYTLLSPYQSISITGFRPGDDIKTQSRHALGYRPTTYRMTLSISRPDLSKPAVYLRGWRYRLGDNEMECSEATDFRNVVRAVGNRGEFEGYSTLDSVPYSKWICIRAEDLTGAYLYKQLQVTAPQLEAVIDGDNLFVLYNPEKPEQIGYVIADRAIACDAETDFSQAQRLPAHALKYRGGPRMLVKPLTRADNGKWFCLWGENRHGRPDLFTLIEVTGITASSDSKTPTAIVRQLPGPDNSLEESVLEIQADELVSYERSKFLSLSEPDCASDIVYEFAGNPSQLHRQTHVISLGRYSSAANSGYWVCYKLYDASGNVGYVKFRYDLPPLASHGINQDNGMITVRGLGSVLYLKFDAEPECHNALDWGSAAQAQPNEEENLHTIKIESQDYGQWLCVRRIYQYSSCAADEACTTEYHEPDITFYKYLIRDS